MVESRPAENGRSVIVRLTGDQSEDVLPPAFNATAKINTYGGGATAMCPDGRIVFTDYNTNGVFFLASDGTVTEILPGSTSPKVHYADFDTSYVQAGRILAVQEVHCDDGKVLDSIVVIETMTKTARVVVDGADFYSHPRFSIGGTNISWTQWNHPDMPWTGSELYVAAWTQDGHVADARHVAGKSLASAVCQPRWSADGKLLFVDEPEGMWQLYRYDPATGIVEYIHLKGYEEVEMGKAEWFLGT